MKSKFLTNPEAHKRIAELEQLVAKCGGSPPQNAAPDPVVAAAVKARLEAGKAALAAAEAKVRAKQAAAAIAPAANVTAESFRATRASPTMTRAEFEKLTNPERNAYIRNGGKLI